MVQRGGVEGGRLSRLRELRERRHQVLDGRGRRTNELRRLLLLAASLVVVRLEVGVLGVQVRLLLLGLLLLLLLAGQVRGAGSVLLLLLLDGAGPAELGAWLRARRRGRCSRGRRRCGRRLKALVLGVVGAHLAASSRAPTANQPARRSLALGPNAKPNSLPLARSLAPSNPTSAPKTNSLLAAASPASLGAASAASELPLRAH